MQKKLHPGEKSVASPRTSNNRNTRIVIVADDDHLAKLNKEHLENNGMHVQVTPGGAGCIHCILETKPDLVILDMMLPDADALEVCRQVRSSSYHNPILMLTAKTDNVEEVLSPELGAHDYIAKPVRPRVLLARVRTLLRQRARTKPQT